MAEALKLAVDNTVPAVPIVRRATDDDMMDVWQLLVHEMHPEVGIVDLDMSKAAAAIANVFSTGYVFVVEKRGEIIGSMGLLVGEPFWYSGTKSLYDRWTFVQPEHRSKKTFDLLKNAAKDLSDNSSIPLVLAIFSPNDADRKNLLFRRSGFTPIGEIFMRGFDRCVSQTSAAAAADRQRKP